MALTKRQEEIEGGLQQRALRAQALEAKRESVRRWLINNPGETVLLCRKATGAPDALCKEVARELGYVSIRTKVM